MNSTTTSPTTTTTNMIPKPRAVSITDRETSMGKPICRDKIEGFNNIGLGLLVHQKKSNRGGAGAGAGASVGSLGTDTTSSKIHSQHGNYVCGQEFFLMNNIKSLEKSIDFLCDEASNISRGGEDIGADVIPPLRDILLQTIVSVGTPQKTEQKQPKQKQKQQQKKSSSSSPPFSTNSKSSLSHPFLIDNFKEQYAKVEMIARRPAGPSSSSSLPVLPTTTINSSSTSTTTAGAGGAKIKKEDSGEESEESESSTTTTLLPFMKELYKVRFGARRWRVKDNKNDNNILRHLLNMAILLGDKPLVFWLLEQITDGDNSSNTKKVLYQHSMCTASYFGRINIIETLIAEPYNCPVDGSHYYTDGKTPIFYAAYGNQVETIKYFIQNHNVRVGSSGGGSSTGSTGRSGKGGGTSPKSSVKSSSNDDDDDDDNNPASTTANRLEQRDDDDGEEEEGGAEAAPATSATTTTTKKKKEKTTTATTTKKKKKKINKTTSKGSKKDYDEDDTSATVGSSSSFEVPPLPVVADDLPLTVGNNNNITTTSATGGGGGGRHHMWDLNSYYSRLSGYVQNVIEEQDLQRLERLIEKFPAVMEDAMIQALRVKNAIMVELIIDKGYPLEIPLTPAYDTALLLAVQQDDIQSARLLLEAGADVNCYDKDGFRCIHVAAEKSNVEMTTLLLFEYNADVDVHTAEGATPLMLHLSNGRNGPSLEFVKLLVNNGVEIDESRSPIFTPLHDVAYGGYTDIAQYLLEEGVMLERRSYEGFTALMYSCEQGHYDCAKMLIDKFGANINAQHPSGRSTLTHTCIHGHLEVVKLLLDNNVDFDDSTFLEAVPKIKNQNIINLLKEYNNNKQQQQ